MSELANTGLNLSALREANTARLPEFLNSKGYPAHAKRDGSDWTPAQWFQAMIGEAGEYANFRKKFERGDITLEEFRSAAEKELADIAIYLDLLARRCLDTERVVDKGNGCYCVEHIPHPTGLDLSFAIISKFNEVSERVKSTVRLARNGWWRE